jgi:hypothetical protein
MFTTCSVFVIGKFRWCNQTDWKESRPECLSKSEPPHTTLENEAGWSDEPSAGIAFAKWRAVAHQQTFAMRLGRIAFV